jgi:hypothetical protein
VKAGNRPLGEGYGEFRSAVTHAVDLSKIDAQLAKIEREYRSHAKVKVTKEPRVYGAKSDNSYYLDLARVASADSILGGDQREVEAAQQRLARYDSELAHEIGRKSKEGKRALRMIREFTRVEHEPAHRRQAAEMEKRALTTGGGMTATASSGAAAFVTPIVFDSLYALWREPQRTFADQCATADLPTYGMQAYIPTFSSAAGAAQHSEGVAVTETDPSTALQGSPVVEITGQVTLSQAIHDRAGAGGGAFDAVIARQLRQEYNKALNSYVLGVVIANGAAVAGAATWGVATFYGDLAKGREALTDTAGTRLRPTHLFTTSDLYSYVTRQVDATTNRPVVVPQFAGGYPIATGADDGLNGGSTVPKWARFTGTVLPGGVLWFTDDLIPASGANTQLLISAPDEAVILAEGLPVIAVYPQTSAASLQVILNLRAYAVAITRHASGTSVITGAGYPTTLL